MSRQSKLLGYCSIPLLSAALIVAHAPAASGWQVELDGGASDSDITRATVVDGADNVISVGRLISSSSCELAVIKHDPAGNELWRTVVSSNPDPPGPGRVDCEQAFSVAVDASNHIAVAGALFDAVEGIGFAVVRLDPEGNVLWTRRHDGDSVDGGRAHSVAVDSTGNIFVTGRVGHVSLTPDILVVSYAPDGSLRWQRTFNGVSDESDIGMDVAVTPSDDVVVAGTMFLNVTRFDYWIAKLEGATGSTLWTRLLEGGGMSDDQALSVVVDSAGGVVSAGFLSSTSSLFTSAFAVVKFDPSGVHEWTRTFGGLGVDLALDVAVDSDDDVLAVGTVSPDTIGSREAMVVKLAGSSGATLWETRPAGGTRITRATASDVSVDSVDDVVVGGAFDDASGDLGAALVKLAGATGNELWRARREGTASGGFIAIERVGDRSVALDSNDDVIGVGALDNVGSGLDYFVVKLDGSDGSDFTAVLSLALVVEPRINTRSRGVVPVHVLTTEDFDATTIDPLSVAFGPAGAAEAHGRGHLEDLNGDGYADVVLHFRTQETGLMPGAIEACMSGQTFGGIPLLACGPVIVR